MYIKKGKISKPLFQLKETDWNFLKRIASELKSELYCDIINFDFMFYFGVPHDHKHELEDDMEYEAFKDLKRFHEAGGQCHQVIIQYLSNSINEENKSI